MEQQPAQPQASFEEEPIDLRKYVGIILKRKWTIILTFALVVSAVAIYTLRQQKIYTASASLVIDSTPPQVLGGEVRETVEMGTGTYWYSKEFYETQYRILRSRAIAQRVVEQLGLDQDLKFLGIDKLPPEQQAEVLPKIDATVVLQSRLFIEPVKDSRIVNVRIEDPDPDRAATLANAVAQAYIQTNLERRVEGAKDAAQWLEDQLADLRTKLGTSEIALYTFKRENDLISATIENKQSITSQKLVAINDTLTRIRIRKAELDARVKSIRVARDSGELRKAMELSVISASPFISQLKLKHIEVSDEAADLRERYGPEHPKMKAAEEKLTQATRSLRGEIDAILASGLAEYDELATTEKRLEVMLDEVKREAFENNKKEIDYKRLAREEENNARLYDIVLKRMKELDLSSLLKTNNVRILDPAQPLYLPIKPRVRTNVSVAALVGLLVGLGLALLLEYQDRSVKSFQDVQVLGINFLGPIPSIPGGDPTQPQVRDLHIQREPKSTVAECCRTIRTNLAFMSTEKPVKRLVVTSASPQQGKTTTLINLGITLALGGHKVVLVDSDMRRPRLHKSFGVSNEVGLSSAIVGDSSIDEVIKTTAVPGLFLLPSGPIPPNPAELLHTTRFQELSDELAARFDRGLFASPPVGAVADALVLANQMEGTLLVLKMLKTSRDLAERAVKSLNHSNARILGAVLNDIDVDRKQYGYYLGYYAYGDYYGQDKRAA